MFVKITAPQGAFYKESLTGMRGDVIKIDDRDLFVNIAASHTIQVTGQAITFDLVKILFQTKEDTAAAAETLRAAKSNCASRWPTISCAERSQRKARSIVVCDHREARRKV